MKKFIPLLFAGILSLTAYSQNQAPVAVNDTITQMVSVGDTLTINVINNDYDQEGDYIRIIEVLNSHDVIWFTDSTITISLSYFTIDNFPTSIHFGYLIEDENGNSNPGLSYATVILQEIEVTGYDLLDVNNISARFNAFGNHFWDFDNTNHYHFPKGEPTQTMWGFSLWLGGIDQYSELRIAAERYKQDGNDYWTGPLSFNSDSAWISEDIATQFFKIWKLNKDDVEYHVLHWNEPGYEPINNILNWPAHGDTAIGQAYYLAPFVDANINGVYEPMTGDYPLIRGDQTLFFIFNDQLLHTETEGETIGVEIHGFAYAFNAPENPALNNTTFLSYKIFNRSQHTLTDTYAGLFSDIDLGYAWDDYVGCDVARGAYYCYNGLPIDGNGDSTSYGEVPPAQGIIVLGGPYMNTDGIDNPTGGCDESINGVGFDDGVVDNERFGMNNFVGFSNWGGPTGDPEIAMEYYNYLQGKWKDSTFMLYGGNGHTTSGAYGPECKFMFPGLSDPCNWGTGQQPPNGPVDWTEVTAGNNPADRRGLCSMGPFTLEPGGFHKVDIAFVTALGDDYMHSVDVLMEAIDSVKSYYFADPDHFGYAWLGNNDKNEIANQQIKIYPNPASNEISFTYYPQGKKAKYILYNGYGCEKKQGLLLSDGYQRINISGLKNGIYILKMIDNKSIYTRKIIKN